MRGIQLRLKKLEINGQPWEVQGVDDISVDGLIVVALKEDYQNSIEEKIEEEKQTVENQEFEEEITTSYIQGDTVVYPYDEKVYTIKNAEGGKWSIGSSKVKILKQNSETVTIGIITGRSGQFELRYIRENEEDIVLNVTIESLQRDIKGDVEYEARYCKSQANSIKFLVLGKRC